jgi:hypothetical protein
MDAALYCAQCGTPARGTRFCTSCGAPLAGPASDDAQLHIPRDQWSDLHVAELQQPGPAAGATAVLSAPATSSEQAAPWISEQPVPPPPKNRLNIFALLVVVALALSGWAIVRGVEQHILSGTVLLVDSTYLGLDPGSPCTGQGGYDDLGNGTQVVLTDEKGGTLSTGRLSPGQFDGLGCTFSFALEEVTRSDFYGLTVGSGSRGELQYSYEELADGDWSVQLSIGDDW